MTSSSLHVVDDSFGEFCYFDIGLTWWMDLEVLALSQKLQLKLEGAQQTITTYMNMNIYVTMRAAIAIVLYVNVWH